MKALLLGCVAAVVEAIAPIVRQAHQPTSNGTKLLTFNTTQSGELYPEIRSFNWVKDPSKDGHYVTFARNGSLMVEDIISQQQQILIPGSQVPKGFREFWFNTNLTKILWATNYRKQYRYSYFADYLIQDVKTGKTEPLAPDQKRDVQYAVWSPSNKTNIIAFVRGNNVYIWKDGKVTQITKDGGPDMFNGIPDWVYEEEIIEKNHALWFNDAGDKLAYVSFNETGVPTYRVQYYMDRNDPKSSVAPPYPRELEIRYPKVGVTNPTAKVTVLNVDWDNTGPKPEQLAIDQFPADDMIVGEVAWLGARIAVRIFNRVQDSSRLVVYDTNVKTYKVAKSQDGTDSWLDNSKAMHYVGQLSGNGGQDLWSQNGCCEEYYLDKTDLTNWDHFYLFPTNYFNNDPIPLTWGDYDVRDISYIDRVNHLLYYTSTERHSTESHLYQISFKTLTKKKLTDDSKPGFYSASFTPGGKYFVLTYEGPNLPYQELYAVANPAQPLRTLGDNRALETKLAQYKLPRIRYADLKHPLGWNMSAMLRYPANFDPNKKYPVLFTPYGGPGAQEVTKRMQSFDFKAYIASDPELEYVTFTVDNRGTGYRGREFRGLVSRHLGQFEADDQIWAAKQLARQNTWVDRNKIAIWGWSYGGYLSAKVVEADSAVFSLGLITAPVSDWRLYDSMYTERYMGLPTTNAENYTQTAVRRVEGFKNIPGGVLLQHGTGDDNVHFQNSAALVDTLIGGGVGPDKLQVQYFTDSDHGIGYNGANRFVYKQLAKKLFEEKIRNATGTQPQHQWSRWGANATNEEKVDAFMKRLDEGEVDRDTWTPMPGQSLRVRCCDI